MRATPALMTGLNRLPELQQARLVAGRGAEIAWKTASLQLDGRAAWDPVENRTRIKLDMKVDDRVGMTTGSPKVEEFRVEDVQFVRQ